jgi:hypothetical protein
VEFTAPPEWIAEVNEEAQRLGLNLSSYIRMVVTQALQKAKADRCREERDD